MVSSNKPPKFFTYLLIGYMWLFIHRPFEIWPWLSEYHIERFYMIFILLYWSLFVPKSLTKSRLNFSFFLFASVIIFSTFISNYVSFSSTAFLNWFKILVFYVLLMTSISNKSELKAIILSFVLVLGLYEFHSLREYINGRGVYRMGTWRMVGVDSMLSDPNSFAASVLYGMPMLIPLSVLSDTLLKKIGLIFLFLLAIICLFLTGSRTGIFGFLFSISCLGIFYKKRFRYAFFVVILLPIIWHILPVDLQNRYLTLIDPSVGPENASQSAESRWIFFIYAINIFKDNIFFGVGPDGFRFASKTAMASHSLYAEIISNLGIFGIISFSFIILSYIKNFIQASRICRSKKLNTDQKFQYYIILATTLGILQMLALGIGGHNLYRYNWLWYGAFSSIALQLILLQNKSISSKASERD